jgi:hypothetical protein
VFDKRIREVIQSTIEKQMTTERELIEADIKDGMG